MYTFQGKTWEQMTPEERLAHSVLHGTAYAGNQGFTPASNQGYLSQFALGFDGGAGQAPANFWDDSDVTNPNNVTNVTLTNSNGGSVGFSGNRNNFSVSNGSNPGGDFTFGGEYANAGGGTNASDGDTNAGDVGEGLAWTMPEETIVKSSTPFLDAYMRARMAAEEKGPVSKIFDQ